MRRDSESIATTLLATALFDGGQLRVPPLRTFTLERTDEALREMATGRVRGKLVITVS